jgi:hypothetical protein
MMKTSAFIAVTMLFCLPSSAQLSSDSVTARDLAAWYASHTIETGHVVVLDRPARVRLTPGTSKSSGEVMLSLYEIDIDNATFRLTLALGIEGGKSLDYFAVENVAPDKPSATARSFRASTCCCWKSTRKAPDVDRLEKVSHTYPDFLPVLLAAPTLP